VECAFVKQFDWCYISEIKMPGQCNFNVHWLEDEQYARWLTLVGDKRKARCKLCLKDIDIGSMGESALKRHASGAKHKDLIKLLEKDTKVVDFLKLPSAAAATKSCTRPTINQDKNSASVSSSQTTGGTSASVSIGSFVSPKETLSAEILWTLKSVTAHYSYSLSSDICALFQRLSSR